RLARDESPALARDPQLRAVRRDVDGTRADGLVGRGELDRERRDLAEPLGQPRRESGRDVLDEEDGRAQIAREALQDVRDHRRATGRGPDSDGPDLPAAPDERRAPGGARLTPPPPPNALPPRPPLAR